jgi:enoyl-CoA hydratase/carnithine racemase
VAWVTLNRPAVHNAFDSQMMRGIYECWRELRENDGVRVVILTGAADKAFCTGHRRRAAGRRAQRFQSGRREE